jgi:hypothetical protein
VAETEKRLETLLRRFEMDLVRFEAALDRLQELQLPSVGLEAQKREIDEFIARNRKNPTILDEM